MKNKSKGLHPRNPHNNGYDFEALIKSFPKLKKFVIPNKAGKPSVDFSNLESILYLNQALIKHHYNVDWTLPKGYLIPPVPGRADYLHHIADLLAEAYGAIPKGEKVVGLDIGTGANMIYPIIGSQEYNWSFIGSELDEKAFNAGLSLLKENSSLSKKIKLVKQEKVYNIIPGILEKGEVVDFTICNPPFHDSKESAQKGNIRKNKNLGLSKKSKLNFGGQTNELICLGGEVKFITDMIHQSAKMPTKCLWYTTLVSKKENLNKYIKTLKSTRMKKFKTIDMQHGQKSVRILAWSFLNDREQKEWVGKRWG